MPEKARRFHVSMMRMEVGEVAYVTRLKLTVDLRHRAEVQPSEIKEYSGGNAGRLTDMVRCSGETFRWF